MKYTNINIHDLIIDDPIYNKKNNSFSSNLSLIISRDDGNHVMQDFVFQTDKMRVNEINSSLPNDKHIGEIILEFQNNYPDFYKFIYGFDLFVLENVFNNGSRWFGNNPKFDTLDQLFERTIVPQEELDKNPTLNLLVDGNCTIEDKNGDRIVFSDLKIENEVSCILNIEKIVFLENKFYLDVKIDKIIVEDYVCQQTEYLFQDSE